MRLLAPLFALAVAVGLLAGLGVLPARVLAASKTTAAKPAADTGDGGATILMLVNDAPITAYTIDQRIKLLALDGGGGWQQRMQAKLHAPDLQQRFKAFAIAHNPKSKEEVLALQKQFVEGLRQQAVAEARPGLRDIAVSQILNETLELQEAKRLSVLASDEEVTGAVADIAKRNKKTAKEFETAITATGASWRAFRDRIRAQMSWQQVLANHFRGQIVVGKTELQQELATGGAAAGGDSTTAMLKLQRITLPLKSGDAAASVAGYAAAEQVRQRAVACKNFTDLAKTTPGARFDDLGSVKTDALSAEAKPVLSSADAGSVPPPILTKTGIEIYGVCERNVVSGGSDDATNAARDKIERQKLEARSRGLLSDLCAAASIEPRNGFTLAKPCGST